MRSSGDTQRGGEEEDGREGGSLPAAPTAVRVTAKDRATDSQGTTTRGRETPLMPYLWTCEFFTSVRCASEIRCDKVLPRRIADRMHHHRTAQGPVTHCPLSPSPCVPMKCIFFRCGDKVRNIILYLSRLINNNHFLGQGGTWRRRLVRIWISDTGWTGQTNSPKSPRVAELNKYLKSVSYEGLAITQLISTLSVPQRQRLNVPWNIN